MSENLNRKDAGDFENVEPDSILAPSVRFPFRPQSFSLFDSGRTQSCRGLRIGENFVSSATPAKFNFILRFIFSSSSFLVLKFANPSPLALPRAP